MMVALVLSNNKFGTIFPHIFHSFVKGAVVEMMVKGVESRHGTGVPLVWKGPRAEEKISRRAAA